MVKHTVRTTVRLKCHDSNFNLIILKVTLPSTRALENGMQRLLILMTGYGPDHQGHFNTGFTLWYWDSTKDGCGSQCSPSSTVPASSISCTPVNSSSSDSVLLLSGSSIPSTALSYSNTVSSSTPSTTIYSTETPSAEILHTITVLSKVCFLQDCAKTTYATTGTYNTASKAPLGPSSGSESSTVGPSSASSSTPAQLSVQPVSRIFVAVTILNNVEKNLHDLLSFDIHF